MNAPDDAFEAGVSIARELRKAGVPHALGGALAYGQYGIPRATNDVDLNVFLEPEALSPALAALRAAGVELDDQRALREAKDDGLLIGKLGPFRIDVFVPSIPFSWEAARSRVTFQIDGEPVDFLSAEALCVFKLLFFRSKDLTDLERLLGVYGKRLDSGWVRSKVVEMMGEDDARVERWNQLLADFMPP